MLNEYININAVMVDGKTNEEVDSYLFLSRTVTRDGGLLP